MNKQQQVRHWVIVPAAGVGSRMQCEQPKQYLSLHGQTILSRTLNLFLEHDVFAGLMLALSPSDPYWEKQAITHPRLHRCDGGAERVHSVLNGLRALRQLGAAPHDWVWVHDAARPLLEPALLNALLASVASEPARSHGALLAIPMADTVKRSAAHTDSLPVSTATVPRETLWRAQTPQVFPLAVLQQALAEALEAEVAVTDEASAMEWAGYTPALVVGSERNLKITRPQDLTLAAALLALEETQ